MNDEILEKYGVDIEKYRKDILSYKESKEVSQEKWKNLQLVKEKAEAYQASEWPGLLLLILLILSVVFGFIFYGVNAIGFGLLAFFVGPALIVLINEQLERIWERSGSVIAKKKQLQENVEVAKKLYDEAELNLAEIKEELNKIEVKPRDRIHNYLEAFYQIKLFNKRSTDPIFRESLAEFAALLNEYKKIHFETTSLYLDKYQSYVDKRSGEYDKNARVQSKELDSARALSEGMSRVKEIEVRKTDDAKSEVVPVQKPQSDQVLMVKQAILEYVQSEKSSGAVTPKIQLRTPEKFFSRPRRVDWNSLNATRKENGNVGELLVVDIERNYLINRGRSDLAKRIRHVSQEADGHGYDVQSFFADGQEKYIEVKSTSATTSKTFQLSKNEFEFLQTHQSNAYVYHVLNVASEHQSTVRVYPAQDVLSSPNISPSGYVVEM